MTSRDAPGPLSGRALGRVLVTGARGFLGAATVARLAAAAEDVVATDVFPHVAKGVRSRGRTRKPSDPAGNAGPTACDVTDLARLDALVRDGAFDTILHCGAVSGPMVMPDRPLDIWRINAGGSTHVLEVARRHGVDRTILCSTSEIYGSRTGPVDEKTLPAPASVYAASKLAAEQAMLGYVHQHGVDAIALRLSWIYGPGRMTATTLETLLRRVLLGESVTLAESPSSITHYLYLDDAVDALLRAATVAAVDSRVFNATAGEGVTMEKVVDTVCRLVPGTRIELAGHGTMDACPSMIDSTAAASELGFRAGVTLEAGIARYLRALGTT